MIQPQLNAVMRNAKKLLDLEIGKDIIGNNESVSTITKTIDISKILQ